MAKAILDAFKQVASERSFQELPIQAQVLYFHMLARANEDGRVPLAYKTFFMLDEVFSYFEFPPVAFSCLAEAGYVRKFKSTEDDIYLTHVQKHKETLKMQEM